ncbi:MAG: heavy metal translocating P-type ATPase [Chloroflexota bacterium]|jgi:Cu2+-exporting ATPase
MHDHGGSDQRGEIPGHRPQEAQVPGGHITEHHPPPTSGRAEREAAAMESHHLQEFQRRFWVCLILTIPILIYADLFQELFGYTAPRFPGYQYLSLILATIIYIYGGTIFLRGAASELATRTPGMMTLIALAITVAYLYSIASQFVLPGEPLYWELATLVDVMLLGHWIEMRSIGRARGALAELARLLPDTAELVTDGQTRDVRIEELRVGDLVLIRPGAKVPADGHVETGESHVNESMITGESTPVPKGPGDSVIAGTVNIDGSLRSRVDKIGEDTTLAGIMRLVEHTQQSRSRAQALADRAAYLLTIVAIVAGAVTFLGWLALLGSLGFALERAVTVLVIACPHALGLAIPLVVAISTTLAARNGLLVRERLALEQARDLDVVVFDKTGTLTKGEHGVVGIVPVRMPEEESLALAAAAEGDSEHMIARAISREAESRGVDVPTAASFEAMAGRGVRARVGGRDVYVGGPQLLETLGFELPQSLWAASELWGAEGKTVVYLVYDGIPRAAFAMADVIRDESREAVAQLKAMGVRVAMLTGDSEAVARSVSQELGIDEFFAQVLPEHKADKIAELKQRGYRVAMVGDGINDAPALLTADVGIAIGAGTNVAIESAGIILVSNDPRDVVKVIRLSRASYRKMVENLLWATGYNLVAIPLAAGILAPLGIFLAPAVGALFMSASTVIVAVNAQLLRRLRLGTT